MATTEEFELVKKVANAAIEDVRRRSDEWTDEPVNWADLTCNEVEWVEVDDGRKFWRVIISEASPDCLTFRTEISSVMRKRGIVNAQVITEW